MCGGRDWADCRMVGHHLEHLLARGADLNVVEGGARGADRCAGRWAAAARSRGVGWVRVPADWGRYGRAAGAIRNGWMLSYLLQARDVGHTVGVLAFHDELERSRGTLDMVTRAEAALVPVKRIRH